MSFLRFILWFLIIYYLFKVITRIFAPILMKRFANKMRDRFQKQYHNQQESTHEEGEVIIEKMNTSAKKTSNDIGEYVDFEEVEE